MESKIKELEEKVEKLQAFKDYVHKRLDDAGVEKEPNGEHSQNGCRIGDRLDLALNQVKELNQVGICPDCGDKGWLYDDNEIRTGICPCHY